MRIAVMVSLITTSLIAMSVLSVGAGDSAAAVTSRAPVASWWNQ